MIIKNRQTVQSANTFRVWLLPIAIFLFAVGLRVQYLRHTTVIQPLRADAGQYVVYALNLLYHDTFSSQVADEKPAPDSFRSPGYPMFLAGVMTAAGVTGFYPAILYVQALLDALMVLMTYGLGIRFLSRRSALAAAILVAASPHLVAMNGFVLTESLFAVSLLGGIVLFVETDRSVSPVVTVSAGMLCGWACLVNETALPVPFLLVGARWLTARTAPSQEPDSGPNRRRLVLFLSVFLIFPIAWGVRNQLSVPASAPSRWDRAVTTLSHGAYPGFIHRSEAFRYYPYEEDEAQPAFGSSLAAFRRILWKRIRHRPLRYARWYLLEKPWVFWSWDNLQSQRGTVRHPGEGDVYVYRVRTSWYMTSAAGNLIRVLMKCVHPLLVVLAACALIGIAVSLRRRGREETATSPVPAMLAVVLVYYTVLYSIFAPWPRYSVPLRPELFLIAVWAAQCMAGRWRGTT